jgi:hypothetical protein
MVSPVPEGITVWTDPDGRFDALLPASAAALIARAGLRVGRAVVPRDGGSVRIVLAQGEAYLEVEVVDGAGSPVSGVRLTVEGDNAIGDTDPGGRARMGPLVPGSYVVRVPGAPPTTVETGVPLRIVVEK